MEKKKRLDDEDLASVNGGVILDAGDCYIVKNEDTEAFIACFAHDEVGLGCAVDEARASGVSKMLVDEKDYNLYGNVIKKIIKFDGQCADQW